jgi:hypothetical protein
MASVSAFTDMMSQFLVELHKVFPQEKGIKKFMAQLELAKTANPRLVVDGFMKGITPYADKISNKDESFLLNEVDNIEYLKDLNLKENWNDSLSSNTKDAIWQYLQTLYMLGTTITAIPAETLSMIEGIAKDCADKMENEGGELDEAALMKTMNSMFGGMLKK